MLHHGPAAGRHSSPILMAALTAAAAYTCMYAFRKPFTAATFDGLVYAGIAYKIWLVVAQALGYMASKFYGIRFISELKPEGRCQSIIILISAAWLALLLAANCTATLMFVVSHASPAWNWTLLLLLWFPACLTSEWGSGGLERTLRHACTPSLVRLAIIQPLNKPVLAVSPLPSPCPAGGCRVQQAAGV